MIAATIPSAIQNVIGESKGNESVIMFARPMMRAIYTIERNRIQVKNYCDARHDRLFSRS